MLLNEYQWSRNPRGMHCRSVFTQLRYERYPPLQLGWYKFVCGEAEYVDDCERMLSMGITPIIRVYFPRQGARPVDDWLRRLWRAYRSAGALWFEFYNEPNLGDEWPPGYPTHWNNFEGCIKPVCDNWLVFAEYIISIGGYPGFPALTESAAENASAVRWMDAMLSYMRDFQRNRFWNILNNGMWFAAHPATLNHFYQQTQGRPNVPRPPELQNGTESGWHFEYPYDPISQAADPGRTVFGGTALTPHGDPNGIIAMGTQIMTRLEEWFDAGIVPVVGTEGGVYPTPLHGPQQLDTRYPPMTRESHAEATVAMFNWLVTNGPAWHFGITVWKEDEYYDHGLPAIERMAQVRQLLKDVPPLSPSAPGGVLVGAGPGPVHGEPDFHFVILAPGLEPEWFFETAQPYWNTFRPIVTTLTDFIPLMPYNKSVAATVIAPPDSLDEMIGAIKDPYPNVWLDLVPIQGDFATLAEIFNDRVWSNQRFGDNVPE